MKKISLLVAATTLCVLCGCNEVECIGDDGHTRTIMGIVFASRYYECKDGSKFEVECGTGIELTNGDVGAVSKKNNCARFTTKDKLIEMNAKER